MDLGEFAHALGVVLCRPPLGDLDLTPRPMHVDTDEEIDGAVAAVLAIVTFELTRLGRDGLAHLTDELDRALVEADHRQLGIGRFGVGSSTSSMRATYSPSTRGMHHISLRQGLRPFSASRRRTVSPDRLSCSVSLTIASASSSSVQRARPRTSDEPHSTGQNLCAEVLV